jgi:hypothetical protein
MAKARPMEQDADGGEEDFGHGHPRVGRLPVDAVTIGRKNAAGQRAARRMGVGRAEKWAAGTALRVAASA